MGSAYLCTRFRKRSGRRGGGRAPPLREVTPGAGSRFGGSKKSCEKICRFGKFAVTLQSFSDGVSRKGSRRHGSASTLIVLQ